jgi:hypothetical protein
MLILVPTKVRELYRTMQLPVNYVVSRSFHATRSQWGQLRSCVITTQTLCCHRRRLGRTVILIISGGKRPINGAVQEAVGNEGRILPQSSRFSVNRECSRLPTGTTMNREEIHEDQLGAMEKYNGDTLS